MVVTVLLVVAAVLFVLGAIGTPSGLRLNLVSAGLFFWVLANIVGRL